ncbi:endonuclease NucS domain-containing protein [Tautonia sp. JC769]|uniref:endonuclease NucS domain-containing protein n=1 Tax=Tautonia sp. JC769 TaxID=3232135 RepID=UPI003458C2C6
MPIPEQTLQTLRSVIAAIEAEADDSESNINIAARDGVIARYGPVFSPENVTGLDEETFRGFLLYKNNRHWTSLHRLGGMLTDDMPRLREALALLVDEEMPLQTRLERLRPQGGAPMVKGLSRSVITAILQVVYPDKYGVWNNTSRAGLIRVGLWPELPRASFAERYEAINSVLLETASRIGIDLWTLDSLWWKLASMTSESEEDELASVVDEVESLPAMAVFGLERHLQDFLRDNWSQTELGRDWDLYEEDGDIVGAYYETGEVGQIDLLARHKSQDRWLVIELKRNKTSDSTVGQLLRYRNWVRRKLASREAVVEGLIIALDVDRRLQYAIDGVPDVRCMTYRINFALAAAPGLDDEAQYQGP